MWSLITQAQQVFLLEAERSRDCAGDSESLKILEQDHPIPLGTIMGRGNLHAASQFNHMRGYTSVADYRYSYRFAGISGTYSPLIQMCREDE